ncbi:MAG: oligosaccharide flippase family protein [Chloroflexi bacterium]|nr:oligosaccharide flippase family protein [Chloroflexota bacterium]
MNLAFMKNGSLLLLSNGFGQGLAFLTSVAIGRLLGVQAFGQYATIMALVFAFGTVVEAGMETTLTREIARRPARSVNLLVSSLVAKCALGVTLWLLLAFSPLAILLAPATAVLPALQLLAVLITLNAANASFSALFRALGRMQCVLIINIAGLSLQLAGVLVLLAAFKSVSLLIAWFVVVQLFELALGIIFFHRGLTPASTAQNAPAPRSERAQRPPGPLLASAYTLVLRSFPFALGGVLGALAIRVDLLMIEALRGAAAAGVYSVAARLLELMALAPNSFLAALLPAFARGSGGSQGSSEQSYSSALRAMTIVALALAACGLLLAEALVRLSFGAAYAAAAGPLRLLSLLLLPLLLNRITTVHLYATNREVVANRALALNLVARVVLGYPAISGWGIEGAALANIVAETIMLGVYWLWGAMQESAPAPQQVMA